MNTYTCRHYIPNFLIIIATLIPLAIGIYMALNYNNPFARNKRKLLCEAIIFIAIGITMLSVYLFSYFDNYAHIYAKIGTDEVRMVEGQVCNLETTDFLEARSDHFTVNGVDFWISYNRTTPGYNKPAAYGGVINKDGLWVRITYIEY